jgi:hypothetical protein
LFGHPFEEGCKRRTAVLAEVVSVVVGHGCSVAVPRFRFYCSAFSFW